MESISQTQRILRILYFLFFACVGLYWLSMKILFADVKPAELGTMTTVLALIATATAAGVLYIRFSRIPTLLSSPTGVTDKSVARTRFYYMLCFVLCESVAIYGLVLFVLGGNRSHAALFFIGAAALFLFCYPRMPETAAHRQGSRVPHGIPALA